MPIAPSCLICDAENLSSQRGMVAPFLAQRIWDRKPFATTLLICPDCGFQFFNPRLSEMEERRLYQAYRGADYQQMRHATEPWYTEKLNSSLSSPPTMAKRKKLVSDALAGNLPFGSIRNVLDFGGARGELIDGLIPGAQGFVYDIGDVPPLPRIKVVALGDKQPFDLVICSNVFEHVASPRLLLQQIVTFCSDGTFVFIEVPQESPDELPTKVKRVAQAGILTLARPRTALDVLRLRTTVVMHEHLNFYSPESLRRLLLTAPGMRIVAEGGYRMAGSSPTIWILAQLGAAQPQESV